MYGAQSSWGIHLQRALLVVFFEADIDLIPWWLMVANLRLAVESGSSSWIWCFQLSFSCVHVFEFLNESRLVSRYEN
jgi:hypothetical protein